MTPVIAVAEADLGADDLRMFRKILRTAGVDQDSVPVLPLEPKRALWGTLQAVNPKYVVTLGLVPSKALLRGKSSFKLEDVLGTPQAVPYMAARVVPAYHPSRLLRGSMKDIKAAAVMWRRIKEFVACPTS